MLVIPTDLPYRDGVSSDSQLLLFGIKNLRGLAARKFQKSARIGLVILSINLWRHSA